MNKKFKKLPNRCDIWGTTVHVIDKWQHPRKNLCIEITEYHKSGRCTVDRKFLANHKPSIDEVRLKELWKAELVIDNKGLLIGMVIKEMKKLMCLTTAYPQQLIKN